MEYFQIFIHMLRVFTAFSGYDSQCMALDQIGINYDLVGWSEIDKFAIEAHNRFSHNTRIETLETSQRLIGTKLQTLTCSHTHHLARTLAGQDS